MLQVSRFHIQQFIKAEDVDGKPDGLGDSLAMDDMRKRQ